MHVRLDYILVNPTSGKPVSKVQLSSHICPLPLIPGYPAVKTWSGNADGTRAPKVPVDSGNARR